VRVEFALVLAGSLVALTACESAESTGSNGDCTSRWNAVAAHPNMDGLMAALTDRYPSAKSFETVGRAHGKRTMDLLNNNQRTVARVVIYRERGGTWVAAEKSHCTE